MTNRMYSELEVKAMLYAHSSDASRVEELMTGSLGRGMRTPLPWCGAVRALDCQGLRMNHGLFTQCSNPKKSGNYCTTCTKSIATNGGTPIHGTVSQRLECSPGDYSININGKVRNEVPYKEVVAKLKLSEEHVRSVAYAAGITLPENTFGTPIHDAVIKIQPEVPEKKTDLIATLVETARATPPTRTEIAKASAATMRTWCQSYAIQPGTKKEMQERLRTELRYNTPSETIPTTPAPKEPEKLVATANTEKNEEPSRDKNQAAVLETTEVPNGEMASINELTEEEYEEEEHICDLFTDIETGTQYLRNAEGELFDKISKEEVGVLHGEIVHLYRDLDAQVNA